MENIENIEFARQKQSLIIVLNEMMEIFPISKANINILKQNIGSSKTPEDLKACRFDIMQFRNLFSTAFFSQLCKKD